MKTLLIALTIVGAAQAKAFNNTDFITGSITQVITAEFDPFIVGDACVVTVATKESTVLLLTDFDLCNEYAEELIVGRNVTVALESSNIITDKNILSILEDLNGDDHYSVDFGAIENGLAD